MIPTKSEIDIQGALPGEAVQMTLDANSLSHLMSVLTNLYSDKTKAVVREYSTNALDSHIEAGVDRPIEVSTPTDFKPYFTVRDYGVGMDAETIREVYSKYGASTKRGTDSQNGMLGLGSKSALTYTTQFNITGIKDGIKTFVVVSRTSDGSGEMKIISQTEVFEGNGVTISIPVNNCREIEKAAHDFFRFWKPGTVLLNGKDPALVKGLQLGKFIATDQISEDYIVMGNVAYPVPHNDRIFKGYHYSRMGIVAYVDMGEINFTPSRESLHMTQLTRQTVNRLRNEFEVEVRNHIEEKIANASTHVEAIKGLHEIEKSNLNPYAVGIKYKGQDIPISVDFDWSYNLGAGTAYEADRIDIKRLFYSKAVIVHGYEYEKIHTTHRQKLRLWIDANDKEFHVAYFVKEVPKPEWLAEVSQVHWSDIKAMKIERKTSNAKNDVFDSISDKGYRISGQKVDPKKKVVYDSPATFASDEMKDLVTRLFSVNCIYDIQLLLVNKNKWKNFKSDVPNAVHLDDMVKEIVDDYVNKMTNEEKLFLRSNWKDRQFCAKLDESKILDPTVKIAARTLGKLGLSEATARKYELMQEVAKRWNLTNVPNFVLQSQRLFEEYPLLNVYGHGNNSYPLDHIYLYMNACYKEKLMNK